MKHLQPINSIKTIYQTARHHARTTSSHSRSNRLIPSIPTRRSSKIPLKIYRPHASTRPRGFTKHALHRKQANPTLLADVHSISLVYIHTRIQCIKFHMIHQRNSKPLIIMMRRECRGELLAVACFIVRTYVVISRPGKHRSRKLGAPSALAETFFVYVVRGFPKSGR